MEGKQQNLAEFLISGSKVANNFRFKPRELLTSCYDFRKSDLRRVQNGVEVYCGQLIHTERGRRLLMRHMLAPMLITPLI